MFCIHVHLIVFQPPVDLLRRGQCAAPKMILYEKGTFSHAPFLFSPQAFRASISPQEMN